MIGLAFDKAVLKGGEEVSLSARIQALAAPASFVSEMGSPDPSTLGTRQTSPMAGSRTPPPPTPNAGTDPRASSEQPALSPNSRGVIGLHGLTLTTAPVDNVLVSTISSDGKNVRLDGGTRMLLVTQASGPEERTQ